MDTTTPIANPTRGKHSGRSPKAWLPTPVIGLDGAPCFAIPLSMGKVAIIDAADLPLVIGYGWYAAVRRDGKGFYARSVEGGRMHRHLLSVSDPAVIVDHRDGDGLNNRRHNIRVGSQSLNCVNRQNTPGRYLRGARPARHGNRWQAYIKHDGHQRSLGQFETEEEAHAAYLAAAAQLYGDWLPDHQAGAVRAIGGKR